MQVSPARRRRRSWRPGGLLKGFQFSLGLMDDWSSAGACLAPTPPRAPRAGLTCIYWSARLSNERPLWTPGPPASTLDYLDLYNLRPSLERVGAGAWPSASPARAYSSPARKRIVDFLLDAAVQSWCAPQACFQRCGETALRR